MGDEVGGGQLDGLDGVRPGAGRIAALQVLPRELDVRHRVSGLDGQLALELADGAIGIVGEQEHGEGVVDVRRLGEAQRELLEGRAGRRRQTHRHEVARAARHEHHLALVGRDLGGQQRQPQGRHAEGLDDLWRIVALERELAERVQRQLELAESGHRQSGMEPGDRPDLGVAGEADGLGLQQVAERFGILPEFEQAESPEGECRAVGLVEADHAVEGEARVGPTFQLVEQRPEIPPCLGGAWCLLHDLLIQPHGVFEVAGLTRRIGLAHQRAAGGGSRRGSGRRCRRWRGRPRRRPGLGRRHRGRQTHGKHGKHGTTDVPRHRGGVPGVGGVLPADAAAAASAAFAPGCFA